MTVADNTSRNQYTATASQTVFAYTFEIVDKDDIVVLKNGTTLSEGTDYTVSNVGNDSGGNVTLTAGATAGDILTLYRDMPYARTQNYTNSGDFLASEVNSDFDNLWLAGEQTNRSFSQSIRKPITDSDSISMELPEAADRTDSFLTFDSTGAVSTSPLSSALSPSIIARQQFTGDGSTTVFTLAADPGSAAAVVIYIDGVYQEEGTYSVSGSTLTFTEAPPTNASIEVVSYKTTAVGTTDANSVTYTPAGTGAVQTTVQTKLRESVSVKDFGATGDGVTDDTAAIQAALDSLSAGQSLVFPAGHTFKIVNATGSGATIVDRRASAVSGGTLYALNSSADNITIVIDGIVEGTSPLDDIIRLTGNHVTVKGSGKIANISGEFLDTNSTDVLLQWRPSNLVLSGDNCLVSGLVIEDQATVGIYDKGNNNKIESCIFVGGPTTHGAGTVQFGIQQTVSGDTRYGGTVSNCTFKRSTGNGACYSGVFSVCKDAIFIGCTFDDLLEHGVYLNATDNVVTGCVFRNIQTGAGLQSFDGVTAVSNKFIDCSFGSILVQRPNDTVISSNSIVNSGLSAIAIRRGNADTSSAVYRNLVISDNSITFSGSQSAIDIAVEAELEQVNITSNTVYSTSSENTYGPIRIDAITAGVGRYLNFSDNIVNGSNIYGLYLRRYENSSVKNNTFIDVNKTTTDLAVRFFNCSKVVFDSNTVEAGANTNRVLFAQSGDGNSNITASNNNGIGLVSTTGAICDVTLTNSSRHSNGRDSLGTKGIFTPANVASATVSAGAAGSVRSPGLVAITPANNIAEIIQAGAQQLRVTTISDGSFTWSTASGSAIGTTGATYMYEIIQ